MSPTSHRSLQIAGIVVAVILLGLAFYPGTLSSPYVTADDTPRYAHTIIPDSSSQYEEYMAEYDPPVYRYEDLSPAARELFDRTQAADPRSQYGGERRYIPTVCKEFVLVCDEYAQEDLPEEFTYGTELSPEDSLVLIEDGDKRYLLQTGTTGHLFLAPFPTGFVLAVLTMLPLTAFIAVAVLKSEKDRLLSVTIGGSVLVASLGVLAPYIEMYGLASAFAIGVVLLVAVWLSILAAGGHRLYRWAAASESHRALDGR